MASGKLRSALGGQISSLKVEDRCFLFDEIGFKVQSWIEYKRQDGRFLGNNELSNEEFEWYYKDAERSSMPFDKARQWTPKRL
jgi:hypothetical protein